jgi:hypothetical protein
MNPQENEIFNQARGAFELATNAKITPITLLDYDPPIEPNLPKKDAIMILEIANKKINFKAEVKTTLTPAILGLLRNKLRPMRETTIIMTRYIPPQLAKVLREMDIQFLDTAGNAYINKPPVYIDIQGKRLTAMGWTTINEKAGARQAGLRVIFAILCKKELINATYREIAVAAGTALGTVDRVFKDLNKRNYITIVNKRERRFNKKRELLDWWVGAYIENLYPKLVMGNYETDNIDKLIETDLVKFDAQWGGELAAGRLTNYLKAERITIYTDENIADLIFLLRLRNRPEGKIEIRKRFWNFEDKLRKKGIVDPILVYADLLATGDPRNIETARIIYDALIGMEI